MSHPPCSPQKIVIAACPTIPRRLYYLQDPLPSLVEVRAQCICLNNKEMGTYVPRWKGRHLVFRPLAAYRPLHTLSPRVCQRRTVSFAKSSQGCQICSREIEICLSWQDQRLCLDRGHCFLKVSVVLRLLGDITILPRLDHDQQVLGICTAVRILHGCEEQSGLPLEHAHFSQKFCMKSSSPLYPSTVSYNLCR